MKRPSFASLSTAASVKRVSLPISAPGASTCALTLLTSTISTPGMFAAVFNRGHTCDATIRGPFFTLYLLPLIFPLPALIFIWDALSSSFSRPSLSRTALTAFVWTRLSILLSIMKGYSFGTMWPLFSTMLLTIVAAMADLIAFLFSFLLIFFDSILYGFGGCAILPPTVPGITAPTQTMLVPLLLNIFLWTLDMPWP